MKKLFAILFAGALFISVPGCGGEKVDKADEPVDGLTVDAPPLGGDDDAGDGGESK